MTDDFLQERTQAPLDRMKDFVATLGAPLVSAVQDRLGTAAAGKKMLDDGGEAAELSVLAKKVSLDAVALDTDITNRIEEAASLYSEAASLLQSQTALPDALRYSAASLAEIYLARSRHYAHLVQNVGVIPDEPAMTDVEWDAVKFIKLRQAKAQLGLREKVGGTKSGRHGNSLFNCVGERESRPNRGSVSNQALQDSRQYDVDSVMESQSSLTPSVIDWSVSVGSPAVERPPMESMASRIQAMGKVEEEPAHRENSETLPRADTLDTLNTCLESLDNIKTVIDTIDNPVMTQSHSSQSTQGNGVAMSRSVDAERIQDVESYHTIDPNAPRMSYHTVESMVTHGDGRRQQKSNLNRHNPPTACSDSHTAPYGVLSSGAEYQYGVGSIGTVGKSMESHQPRVTGGHPASSQDQVGYSIASFALGTGCAVVGEHTSQRPDAAQGSSSGYNCGDSVEIFSKSAGVWVKGTVVNTDGLLLTVQYGDRQRKVDLAQNVSDYFRHPSHSAYKTKPAFDSMMTHAGGAPIRPAGSEVSVEPRFTKAAVL
jgi:hypothetical protein